MDRPHWPQEIVVKPMEQIVVPNTNTTNSNNNFNNLSKPSSSSSSFERRLRPQKAAAVNCPRYWTEGGTLRNIPVGGGSRKNKRSSSSSSTTSSSQTSVSKKLSDLVVPSASTSVLSGNPRIHHDRYGQDLNLGNTNSSASTTTSASLSAMELLTGITARGTTNNCLMPIPIADPNSVYSQSAQLMIPMPEFKIPTSLSFSIDGMATGGGGGGSGGGGTYGIALHDRRLLFPFEELKSNASTNLDDQHVGQDRDQNDEIQDFEEDIIKKAKAQIFIQVFLHTKMETYELESSESMQISRRKIGTH
ncbi:hypothetical protein LXL04_029472 [Taraxacum kok-saghyz]